MPTPRKSRAFAALLLVALGFALGYYFRPRTSLAPTHDPAPPAAAKPTTAVIPAPAQTTNAAPLERLRFLIARDFNLSEAILLVRQLDVADCKIARTLFGRLNRNDREVLSDALAHRWAQLDPVGAFDHAQATRRENDWSNRIGFAAGEALVAVNPQAALDRITAARTNDLREKAAEWVLPALAKTNGRLAADYLARNPRLRRHEHIWRSVADSFASSAPLEALAWTQSLEPKSLREACREVALDAWARSDPHALLAAALADPDLKENSRAVGMAVNTWSASDLSGAIAWVRALENSDLRDQAFRALNVNAAQLSPESARELLAAVNSDDTRRDLATRLAQQFASEDIHDALAWIETLPVDKSRAQALSATVRQWAASDPNAAANYIASQPASPERAGQIADVIGLWTQNDPAAATAFAQRLPAGKDRDLSLARIIDQATETSFDEAFQLALTLQDPEALGQSGRKLLPALVRTNAVAAIQFAERIPAESQPDAYRGMMRAWASEQPELAEKWLTVLPEGPGRDAAIKAYTSEITDDDPAAATRWAWSIQDPTERIEAAFNVFDDWVDKDTAGAEAWLNQTELPDGLRPFFEKQLAEEMKKRGQ